MKRRGKMFSRVIVWSLGGVLGFYLRKLTGGHPDPEFYIAFWSGMMLAAALVHFDPPAIEQWERAA